MHVVSSQMFQQLFVVAFVQGATKLAQFRCKHCFDQTTSNNMDDLAFVFFALFVEMENLIWLFRKCLKFSNEKQESLN